MKKVIIAGKVHRSAIDHLGNRPDIDLVALDSGSPEALDEVLPEAEGVLWRTQPLTPERLSRAPRLRIVSRHGVGYDMIDVPALTARGIPLTIVGDVNSGSVAEHTLFLILATAKQAIAHDRATRKADWTLRDRFLAQDLEGKTLLVVGFGRIGRKVASMAAAFGLKLMAHDPFAAKETIAEAGAEPVSELKDGLGRADIVTIHVPLTGGGPLIGAGELAATKEGAILVNTARGGHVDEAALVDALQSGRLSGAGLDVFAVEPPVAGNPLYDLDNVVLSPHNAGLTEQCAARMGHAAAKNITDLFDGKLDPAMVINREVLEGGS